MFKQITKEELDIPENKTPLIFLERQSKRPCTTHPDWIFGRWYKDEPVWVELGNL